MSSTSRSAESYKYSIPGKRAKDALHKDEQELYELCCLAGVEMSPAVFRIVMNLVKMNVSPIAIIQMLKSMVNPNASVPIASLISNSTASSGAMSDLTGALGHSSVKRTVSASAVSGSSGVGGSSTSRSMKASGSKSGTSLRTESSGRPRSSRGHKT